MRLRWACSALLFVAVIYACKSDEAPDDPGATNDVDASTSGGEDSSSGVKRDTGTTQPKEDAGEEEEGDAEAGTKPKSDPAIVSCMGKSCFENNRCCATTGGDTTCAGACNAGTHSFRCDERADCDLQFSCFLTKPGTYLSDCYPGAPANSVKLCKLNNECDGQQCKLATCGAFELYTCGGVCP